MHCTCENCLMGYRTKTRQGMILKAQVPSQRELGHVLHLSTLKEMTTEMMAK